VLKKPKTKEYLTKSVSKLTDALERMFIRRSDGAKNVFKQLKIYVEKEKVGD